jgi:hypothetical protein
MQNVLNINIKNLPPEAVNSIVNFYEFVRQKYQTPEKKQPKSRRRLLSVMEKGLYTLPKDYSFNRDELYD